MALADLQIYRLLGDSSLIIALAGGFVGYLATDENEDEVFDALGTAIRLGYVVFQVSLVLVWLAVLLFVGSWLLYGSQA